MREKIFGYAVKEYVASPEYLWARYPGYAVLRRSDSKKWFAVIMDIPFEKIDPRKSGTVDVLKATPHDHRLTPLCAICLPDFRHNTQFYLVLRQ